MSTPYPFFIDEFKYDGLNEVNFKALIDQYLSKIGVILQQNKNNKVAMKLGIWAAYYSGSGSKEEVGKRFGVSRSSAHRHICDVNYILMKSPDFGEIWEKV